MRTGQQMPQSPAPMRGQSETAVSGQHATSVTEFEPAPAMMEYPSEQSAQDVMKYKHGYGSGQEGFMQGKNVDVVGRRVHPSAFGGFQEQRTIGMDAGESTDVKYTAKTDNPKVGKLVSRGMLAAERSAIAKLGFDARVASFEEATDKPSTIMGVYSPSRDRMNIEMSKQPGADSAIVHESVHRGLEKVWQDGGREGKRAVAKLMEFKPGDNVDLDELTTRYIMVKTMGDPEKEAGPLGIEQRQKALDYFRDNPDKMKELVEIEKIAARLLKERKPGGPR